MVICYDFYSRVQGVYLSKIDHDFKLPKQKSKKTNGMAYDTLIRQYIAEQITAHQNPYWEIRY